MSLRVSVKTLLATLAFCLPAVLPCSAQTASELIAEGDVHDAKLQTQEALKYFKMAEKLEPENAQLLVRLARQYRHLMSDASGTDEKLRLGSIAVEYSRRAVALSPRDAETNLSEAISYGKVLPYLSSKERYNASQVIKTSADRTIKLDPSSDLGWHILGRWNARLAGVGTATRAIASMLYGKLPTTSYDDAIKCFKQAIALNPNRLMHYIELGCAYAETGKNSEARQCLKKGLAMANTEKDDPETKRIGKEMLARLQ